MARQLKIFPVTVDDLFPVMIIGFGYNQSEVIKRMKKKFPSIDSASSLIFHKPIKLTTGVIFGIDTELQLLTKNKDIQECLNCELVSENGDVLIQGKLDDSDKDIEEVIVLTSGKEKDESDDKKARWA